MIDETFQFGSLTLKLFMLDEPPYILSGKTSTENFHSLFTGFLTFQEILARYSRKLPLPTFPENDGK